MNLEPLCQPVKFQFFHANHPVCLVFLLAIVPTCPGLDKCLSGKQGVVNRNPLLTAGSVSDMHPETEKAAWPGGFLPSETPLYRSETKLHHSCCGVPGRIRTRDPLLRRQPLYPLSYWDPMIQWRVVYRTLHLAFILQEIASGVSRQNRRLQGLFGCGKASPGSAKEGMRATRCLTYPTM